MLSMTSRHDWARGLTKHLGTRGSERLVIGFVMDGVLHHPILLCSIKFRLWNHPAVSVSDFTYLLVESVFECSLDSAHTSTTSRMSYNTDLIEARVHHVPGPYVSSMLIHGTTKWDCFALCISAHIWVHHQYRDSELLTAFNKW